MLEITIRSRGTLRLDYCVLDLNGTIALDGELTPGVGERLALPCLTSADIVVPDINAALDLLLRPRRVLATLRA